MTKDEQPKLRGDFEDTHLGSYVGLPKSDEKDLTLKLSRHVVNVYT